MDSIKEMLETGRQTLAAMEAERHAAQAAKDAAAAEKKARQFAPVAEAASRELPAALHGHVDLRDGEFNNGPTDHEASIEIPGLAPFRACFHVTKWTDRNEFIGQWSLLLFRIPRYYVGRDSDGNHHVAATTGREWSETPNANVAAALAFDAQNHRLKLELECTTANALLKERRAARLEQMTAEPTAEESLIAALRRWVLDVVPVGAE